MALSAVFLVPSPKLEKLNNMSPLLVDKAGKWLYVELTSNGYWRLPAQLDSVDDRYISALLHYEDERFYQHPGVDAVALLRASWQWLINGRVISGASTISMQLAKLLDPQPRTFTVKLKEIFQAIQLELNYSKESILEKYLTLVPMGGNLEGVTAASYAYFGHGPKQLTWGQIALLVSLPQSPEARRPDRNPVNAESNRLRVLQRFYEKSLISYQDLERAASEPVPLERKKFPRYAYHYAQEHKEHNVQSSIQFELQSQIESILDKHAKLNSYDGNRSFAVLVKSVDSKETIAYVGSSGIHTPLGFNDMVKAIRSPGSSLKPFIYALAYRSALAYPQTIIRDEPININGFSPHNYDNKYRGDLKVSNALSESINTPAIKLLNKVGVTNFLEFLNEHGANIRLDKEQNPGLAIGLGGGGTNLNELIGLYEQLTPSGSFFTPTIKSMVYDSLPKIESYAYKTGTSYGHRDAWAIGYNRNHVIGVWTGRIDGTPIDGQTGTDNAKPLLKKIINLLPQTDHSFIEKIEYEVPSWLVEFEPSKNQKANPIIKPSEGDTFFLSSVDRTIFIKLRDPSQEEVLINGNLLKLPKDEQNRLLWTANESGFYEIQIPEKSGSVKFRIVLD